MVRPLFEKRLIAVLDHIGREAKQLRKEGEDVIAIPVILFSEKRKRRGVFASRKKIVCGCAFPESNNGCSAAGEVRRKEMNRVIAKIYKKGYVPIGVGMISTSYAGHTEYGSIARDREKTFSHMRRVCESFKPPVVILVIDAENTPYWAYWGWSQRKFGYSIQLKVERLQLIKTERGAVWIFPDSWISSLLEKMGEKELQ